MNNKDNNNMCKRSSRSSSSSSSSNNNNNNNKIIFPNVCRRFLELMSSAQNFLLKVTHAVFMQLMQWIF